MCHPVPPAKTRQNLPKPATIAQLQNKPTTGYFALIGPAPSGYSSQPS
jgi:hypothetical protein